MTEFKTLSFCELRAKEVVNVLDGRRLGRIVDIIFESVGKCCVKGIVVPFSRKFFFFRDKEIFIPWHCIKKIGDDVILVNLIIDGSPHSKRDKKRGKFAKYENAHLLAEQSNMQEEEEGDSHQHSSNKEENDDEEEENSYKPKFSVSNTTIKKKPSPQKENKPLCDKKCEKCMLFDCERRWQR